MKRHSPHFPRANNIQLYNPLNFICPFYYRTWIYQACSFFIFFDLVGPQARYKETKKITGRSNQRNKKTIFTRSPCVPNKNPDKQLELEVCAVGEIAVAR